MGICLTSRKSSYSFDMGYGGFYSLRTNICKAFDNELGTYYRDVALALANPEEYNRRINMVLKDKRFKKRRCRYIRFPF